MLKTKTRYIPQGMVEFKPSIGDYPKNLCAVYVDREKNLAIFYKGKSNKHLWYNRFRTQDDMKEKIIKTIVDLMAWEDKKVERKEARKAPTTLKVGDILYTSWGYDQTNVDFYQVVKTLGKQTVQLRKIASEVVSRDGGPSTHVVARKDVFIGDKVTTHRAINNRVRINSYATAYPWDGKPQYETACGWGH